MTRLPLLRAVAGGSFFVAVVLYAAGAWFAATGGRPAGIRDFTWAELLWPIPMLAFAAVGAIVASRRSENPVGWCFLGIGLLMTFNYFCESYARAALADDLPLAHLTAWFGFWSWVPAVGLFPFVFFLFPDGRARSARWRVLVALAIAVEVAAVVSALLVFPRTTETLIRTMNLGDVEGGAALAAIGNGGVLVLVLVSIVSLVMRFVGSRGVERQQIKWFAFGAALMALSIAPLAFLPYRDPFSVGWVVGMFTIAVSSIPLAAGVSILKYRLYDIDRIVNRTLVYTLLTVVLAGSYLLIVVLLQSAISPLARDSDIAVAGSTLAVAAMFRPIKARVQDLIDRSFYRRRYDAAETLEAFAARLRDQVDLESLSTDLVTVVGDVMHPAHAAVWLRESESR